MNALADMLSDQKVRAIEATALLQRVVDEIDAPLFAFDPDSVLRLVNPAGEHLMRQMRFRMVGRTAAELNLEQCLTSDNESVVELNLNDSQARWLLRRSSFRQHGVPHTLVVLSDVSRALREEERRAWQRLIRVLGHELSNSLAPIKSIAGSLRIESLVDYRWKLRSKVTCSEAWKLSKPAQRRFTGSWRRTGDWRRCRPLS